MEGATGWASLGLQARQVESPEGAEGAGWAGGARGRSLKKIYIYCTHLYEALCVGRGSGAASVSAGHGSGGALPPPGTSLSAGLTGSARADSVASCLLLEREGKSQIQFQPMVGRGVGLVTACLRNPWGKETQPDVRFPDQRE